MPQLAAISLFWSVYQYRSIDAYLMTCFNMIHCTQPENHLIKGFLSSYSVQTSSEAANFKVAKAWTPSFWKGKLFFLWNNLKVQSVTMCCESNETEHLVRFDYTGKNIQVSSYYPIFSSYIFQPVQKISTWRTGISPISNNYFPLRSFKWTGGRYCIIYVTVYIHI